MRLIDADALNGKMCEGCDNKHLCKDSPACEMVQQIDAMPTIKAEPVKHGHWIDVEPTLFREKFATCSVCRVRQLIDKDNFCSNCGAKMDEVEE